MNRQLQNALSNFKACADLAPEGTYADAKALNVVIGDAVESFMREVRALGLKADSCDRVFDLEAAMYEYVKRSNPDHTMFPVSEGFGTAMEAGGLLRERVLSQAEVNNSFLRDVSAIPNEAGRGGATT